MADVVVRSEIPSDSGLGEDKFTNTFAFTDVPDLGNATLTALMNAVEKFYVVVAGGALVALSDLYSPEVDTTAGQWALKAYDATGKLDGQTPLGAPEHEYMAQFLPAAGTPAGLPAEVAMCLTLETDDRADAPVEEADGADAGTERDRPMQRHTGRVFLGPLNVNCLGVVFGQVRPASNIMDTARLAASQLQTDAFVDAGGSQLAVWSRKDAIMRPVGFVSTDNSFDTIRSRGPKATARDRDSI